MYGLLLDRRACLLGLVILVGFAGAAKAQSPEWRDAAFLHVDGGFQRGSHELAAGLSFPVYGESGALTTTNLVEGGGLFDARAGVRVWQSLAMGAGFSRFSESAPISLNARIPHPLIFDRPRSVSMADAVTHEERAVHFQASWFMPLNERLDVSVFGGPSVFQVHHGFVTGVSFRENASPFDTVTLTRIISDVQQKTTLGFNVGGDMTIKLVGNVGLGTFLRYSAASATFDQGSAATAVDVGGLQGGAGVRLRF